MENKRQPGYNYLGGAVMKKILFADDDPEIREVVRILLTREGYEVVEAVNGIEAVERRITRLI